MDDEDNSARHALHPSNTFSLAVDRHGLNLVANSHGETALSRVNISCTAEQAHVGQFDLRTSAGLARRNLCLKNWEVRFLEHGIASLPTTSAFPISRSFGTLHILLDTLTVPPHHYRARELRSSPAEQALVTLCLSSSPNSP